MKALKLIVVLISICFVEVSAQTIMNIHQSNGTVLQIPINGIDSITYTVNNPGNLGTLTTLPIGNIAATSAQTGGIISNNGGTNITQRGVCWSTSPNPTTANAKTNNGTGTGTFTSNLTGLIANTTYYVRAYAINSAGTAYGNALSFTTAAGGGGIVTNPGSGVTFDGFTYTSIIYGNGQEWMIENLRTTVYANGDPIPNIVDNSTWQQFATPGAWCYLSNFSQYDNPYGKLYNWKAVTDPRNVCPTGWHTPSDTEWTVLVNYLVPNSPYPANTAGGLMKNTGTQYWFSPNVGATNESGFNALPAGTREYDGTSGGVGIECVWWSSTYNSTSTSWGRRLYFFDDNIERDDYDTRRGLSVRCLKD
jgi:uncharacterized protein (TIGR02145 family)